MKRIVLKVLRFLFSDDSFIGGQIGLCILMSLWVGFTHLMGWWD
jgi:hypothetical protein